MNYWLQPRYTATPELLQYVVFDEAQICRGLGEKMAVGDLVLFYHTGNLGGPKAVVASAQIVGALERVPEGEPTRRGGRDWEYRRRAVKRVCVPAGGNHLSLPLAEVRRIMGWKSSATIRQAMRVAPERFAALEQALRERLVLAQGL